MLYLLCSDLDFGAPAACFTFHIGPCCWERSWRGNLCIMNFIISISLHICVMKVAFILFKAPLEPEMNLSQILLDGNPPLCQTPKPKRFRTEEMIDIQTRGLHGLKTEARTRPVPEIVWPDPTRAARLNLEPEPDPRSPPPPPQRIANKKKEKGCISRLHAKK